MIKLENITKSYGVKSLKQTVLKNISICFKDKGFVFILGPSGCGKTTLLNIIGGLDKPSEGSIYINGCNMKKFKDKNLDAYRNKHIGFIFQQYNLISYQNALENVILAPTIAGKKRKERIKRSKIVLEKVGLKDLFKKKPNEISGGERQRVAIARALVNNPDVILADEATGALDTVTSKQVMDILKDISKEKLVIMVTHNEKLAYTYGSRIIKIKDGVIEHDSNPCEEENDNKKLSFKKKKISIFTALFLSLKNLLTKKSRTFLTSFSGAIGIIGIALILSLSKGTTNYIKNIEKETISSYPIAISLDKDSFEYDIVQKKKNNCQKGYVCFTDDLVNYQKNNLKDFRKNIINNYENINNYVSSIKYSYNVNFDLYKSNNKVSIEGFHEIKDNNKYDLVYGSFPNNFNEFVIVLNENDLFPLSVIKNLNIENEKSISYEKLLNEKYQFFLKGNSYKKNGEVYEKIANKNYIDIGIVGIIKPKKGQEAGGYIGYSKKLTDYVIEKTNELDIIKEYKEKNINLLTNLPFDSDEEKGMFEKEIGLINAQEPSLISIYPKNFSSKEKIENIIKKYNETKTNEDKIEYVDYVKVLVSSLTNIINIITYILISFVAVSLIVSSIMISIITYISVLERTKEIGILRAIGASKKDISRVFNAETIIIGLLSGVIGIICTILINKGVDKIIYNLIKVKNITSLSVKHCIILIVISVLLSFMSGLIPAKKASKKDPVISLKSQ